MWFSPFDFVARWLLSLKKRGGREEKREAARKEGKQSRWECFGVQQALTGEIDWREIKNDVSKRFRNKVRGHRQKLDPGVKPKKLFRSSIAAAFHNLKAPL